MFFPKADDDSQGTDVDSQGDDDSQTTNDEQVDKVNDADQADVEEGEEISFDAGVGNNQESHSSKHHCTVKISLIFYLLNHSSAMRWK